jgi:hypothetical protein
MGRPIQKRKIGNQPGRIAVTNVKWADGTAQADNENGVRVYISRQRSTKRFLVEASDGSKSEVCTLVGKAPALVAGTFDIAVEVGDDLDGGGGDGSTIYWAVKLKNRTVDVQADNDPSTLITRKYTLQAEASDEENLYATLGIANIDVL